MISPLHSKLPPYALPSNIVYFHDWRYVHHGRYDWLDEQGRQYPLQTVDPYPPLRYEPRELPTGIELVAMPATRSEPVYNPPMRDEICIYAGSVMRDEGRYRWWFETWPTELLAKPPGEQTHQYVRYAESDNGFDWRFPKLGLIERHGSRENNCVVGPSTSPNGWHGGCVFKDPSGPSSERYKAFYTGRVTPEQRARFERERPEAVGPHRHKAILGAVSPDGLAWTELPEPLVLNNSDTQHSCEYDASLGQYVAYNRSWFFNRRSIGRMATTDFRRFPLHEEVFWPDGRCKADETWYTNAKTLMPGTTDYHVMFPMRWRTTTDAFDFYLAASPDNVVWGLVPGGAVCRPGEPGAWDGGVVTPGTGLVELPGDRMGILIFASPVPHKHPRRPPFGSFAWAWWRKGRLAALRAEGEASFSLWPLTFKGRTVELNCRTAPGGYVRVEAVDNERNPLPGRRFEDCDPLIGDHLSQTVTWRGQADLGHQDGSPVMLRFRMRATDLYSVRFNEQKG